VIFLFYRRNFTIQPEEETSSAGEQLVSNKVEGYSIQGGHKPPFLMHIPLWLLKLRTDHCENANTI